MSRNDLYVDTPEGTVVNTGYVLPCDVALPPGTTFKKGTRLSAMLAGLQLRENPVRVKGGLEFNKRARGLFKADTEEES